MRALVTTVLLIIFSVSAIAATPTKWEEPRVLSDAEMHETIGQGRCHSVVGMSLALAFASGASVAVPPASAFLLAGSLALGLGAAVLC